MTDAAQPPFVATRGPRLRAAARSFGHLAAIVFGYGLLVLSAVVVVEAVGRKLLGFSVQGADELGGYIFAVGSALCFITALVERAHIRIDLFHAMLPRLLRAALDWLSVVLMATFAAMISWLAWLQLADSAEYHSTAPTPWATALVWPQAFWVAALVLFALIAIGFAIDATLLLLGGRLEQLGRSYGPKETIEEVHEELEDLERR
jgi:TRAP-type C4-dicarboxylate transport system permease small subunit